LGRNRWRYISCAGRSELCPFRERREEKRGIEFIKKDGCSQSVCGKEDIIRLDREKASYVKGPSFGGEEAYC